MYSRFWHLSETAGPSILDVARFWDREPRILRSHRRSKPLPLDPFQTPTQLTSHNTQQVAAFWKREYRGVDWGLDADESWVQTILSSPKNYVLGVFYENQLVGTIVSRPAVGNSNSVILLGEKGYIQDSRVIEGLCIDAAWRGKHLAGWLIAWIDYWTDQRKPTVHFWLREVPNTFIKTTELCGSVYGFVKTADLPSIDRIQKPAPEPVSFQEFLKLWQTSMYLWRTPTGFISSAPFSETGEEGCWEIWRYQKWLFVIQNTRRKTLSKNLPIWEVAWIGLEKTPGHYFPRLHEDPLPRSSLEAVAVAIADKHSTHGLLFGTDTPHQGGLTANWTSPWKFGVSGKHLTYIYNFMPPAFWMCNVQIPRLEL